METKSEPNWGLPRVTKQRKAIFLALQGDKSHPTAEEIYRRVKEQLPSISLATVYRNLKLLSQEGLIQEVTTGDGPSRYDFQTHDHYHFVCDRCERVFDVELQVQSQFQRHLSRQGFAVRSHDLVFHGFCPACRSTESAD
jgi:Fe2+ or Zn2+ uptake regulation protein